MRSASVLDPQALPNQQVRDLLVLWQHPESREIIPIGRFSFDGQTYSFAYTRAAASIENFRPLPGLSNVGQRYDSVRIPPAFGQRVMESGRPDFVEYAHSLGLRPSEATPWEQIVHSAGARAGDTLQFMQVPAVSSERARARFLTNGVRHIPGPERSVGGRLVRVTAEEHEGAIGRLTPDATVTVEPEAGNPEDADACVVTSDSTPLGWVPRALSSSMRELMASGPVTLTVVRVGDSETPPHLRLVLDLDVPAPSDFRFDRDGRWEPVVTAQ